VPALSAQPPAKEKVYDVRNKPPPARGLRLSGERRGEKAEAERGEEHPPVHYWVTSSARSSSDGGMVS
jgi:hypothetical protein